MSRSDMIDACKSHPIYSGDNIRREARSLIGSNFKIYKTFPFCRDCAMECKMPNVPTLELKACPRTLGYATEAKSRGGLNV
jgi:hypothetical protein